MADGGFCISTSHKIHQQLDRPAAAGAFPCQSAPTFLLFDHDQKDGLEVRAAIRSMRNQLRANLDPEPVAKRSCQAFCRKLPPRPIRPCHRAERTPPQENPSTSATIMTTSPSRVEDANAPAAEFVRQLGAMFFLTCGSVACTIDMIARRKNDTEPDHAVRRCWEKLARDYGEDTGSTVSKSRSFPYSDLETRHPAPSLVQRRLWLSTMSWQNPDQNASSEPARMPRTTQHKNR